MRPSSLNQRRCAHQQTVRRVPEPTPFVPDATTFLTLIGRNMAAHSSKFPTWKSLFHQSSQQLRDAGLEPARARRYLLRWRDKFRHGEYGIGGDLSSVVSGAGELRIVTVRDADRAARADLLRAPGERRVVLNVAPEAGEEEVRQLAKKAEEGEVKPVAGVRIKSWDVIAGRHVKLLKGGRAEIRVAEGLWEHKRGVKVDGGERRKAEVRAKRRAAENRQ